VILSVAAAATSTLDANLETRLEWTEKAQSLLDPKVILSSGLLSF
jgi:hypothetical protein